MTKCMPPFYNKHLQQVSNPFSFKQHTAIHKYIYPDRKMPI